MALIKKFRIKSFKKNNTLIEFENVSLSYGKRLILDNVSFKINEGQILEILNLPLKVFDQCKFYQYIVKHKLLT